MHYVDEMCICGHPILLHGGPGGHGVCEIHDCKCDQFTWVDWFKPLISQSGHAMFVAILDEFQTLYPDQQWIAGTCQNILIIKPTVPSHIADIMMDLSRGTVSLHIYVRHSRVTETTWMLADPEWTVECNTFVRVFIEVQAEFTNLSWS